MHTNRGTYWVIFPTKWLMCIYLPQVRLQTGLDSWDCVPYHGKHGLDVQDKGTKKYNKTPTIMIGYAQRIEANIKHSRHRI